MTAKRYIIGIFVILATFFSNHISAQDFNLSTDDVSCIVGRGRVFVNVTLGTGAFSYYLYDGNPFSGGTLLDSETNTFATSHTFSDWPAATYWVAVDATEGGLVKSVTLSTVQDEALSVPVITIVSGPTCINSTDASLEATVTGGNPPYTYTWSPNTGGQTTKIATGLGQGTYSVTVNDSYNCGSLNQRVIFYYWGLPDANGTIPDSLNAGQIGNTQDICAGGDPTTITEVSAPSGGSGGYSYTWEYQNNCAGAWNLIPGANSSTYDPPAGLMQTRCYRRIVTNTCGIVTSNTITVTVNPLPTPTVSGTDPACQGSTGNTYTTEAGNSNYTWIVSAGGTITSGGGASNDFVTVTWNSAGPQSVSVNYENSFGCTAVAPAVLNLTVDPAPAPSLNGPSPVCQNSTGNTYTTDAGMTNYTWVVSAGGTITSGGGVNDASVEVTWTAAGSRSVSVNYSDGNNCRAISPTVLPITVDPLPVPSLNGPTPACVNSTGNIYTTDAGMTNYAWTVSAGGTITGGGGINDNTITVTWTTDGAQFVSVNYTNGDGCTGAVPTTRNVTVNPLPVPTIIGPTPVCVNSVGNTYTTEAGMSNYVWTVSGGGTITGGGGATDNTVTITWNTAGPQSVSASYTNTNGCTAAAPTTFPVNVLTLPVPNINGPSPVCMNSAGNTYTTDAGMTNYVWTVSSGGTITSGGGVTDNTVTITWNTAGPQSVSISYTNGSGCTAATPSVLSVTVDPLPVPTINGTTPVCVGSIETYTTEAGMSNYNWTVPSGGSITAGGGVNDNFATVTWTAAGAQSVRVGYTAASGCTSATPTIYSVTVNPLPVPSLNGPTPVCVNSAGNIYTTDAGMTNYAWTVSAGGTITSGGGINDNNITVTWTTDGAKFVSVNYTNGDGCTGAAPTTRNVTVNPLPVPTLNGPSPVCVNSAGNTYISEAGMSNYVWTVSGGGTITSGGGAGDNTVTITWNTAGPQSVSISYTNINGCEAAAPTTLPVTVNPLPVPALNGPTPVCDGSIGNIYNTDPGMTNYVWTISAGGTVTNGGSATDDFVEITWNSTGAQTVGINYTNGSGCIAASPTILPVNVNPLPVPSLNGPNPACEASIANSYTTDAGMTNYIWVVSGGGTITNGGGIGDDFVEITWNSAGPQSVSVSYTDDQGCIPAIPTVLNITVNPLPVPALGGPTPVCENSTGNIYSTDAGMSNYVWIISGGGTITNGGTGTDDFVEVTWTSVGAQSVSLIYTDINGCTASIPTSLPVTVDPIPVPLLSGPNTACESATGNVYTTDAGMINYTWIISAGGTITNGGGVNDNTVEVTWNSPGSESVSVNYSNASGCSASIPTTENVNVIAAPIVEAGTDATICNDDDYSLTGASVTNVVDFSWRSSGTGTFDDPDIINPVYTPSMVDRQNGSVTIYLDAVANAPCLNVTDSFILTIPPPVQPAIGAPAPFVIGPNTEINVCLATSGHAFIVDMGYYLVAPDGNTVFTLKKGPMEVDFYNPCTVFPPPPGDLDTLCFTTELTLSDTLDVCTESRPIDGTFAATGDWSMLYGMNPAEGGWSVMIKDTANNMGGIDGDIVYASMSFADTATSTGEYTTVDYYSGTVNIPILEPANTSYIIPRALRESCPGACDAIALVNTLGGTPPYVDYNWSPAPAGGNGTDSVLLCAGTYNLTVTDALGCTGTTSVDVISPPAININEVIYTDTISCHGDTTGFISIAASGGTGKLTFTLLPAIPSEKVDTGYFSGLPVGTYTVRIEDIKGCFIDTIFTINEPLQLVLESAAVTDSVFCTGDTNGRIVATASGGTKPYSFILEPLALVNDSGIFENLAPGSYLVRLTDANSCDTLNSDTLILGIPVPLAIDTVITTPIICNGANGAMTVVTIGGQSPYDIYVDGVLEESGVMDTTTILRGPGNYAISVEDANGCTDSWASISLIDPPVLQIDSIVLTPITGCYTDSTGEILVYATGGIAPLAYASNGGTYQPGNFFDKLTGGNYRIYVRDNLGCVHTQDTTMISPPLLLGNPFVTNIQGDSPGSILMNPTGGTPYSPPDQYRYSINGGALTANPLFEDLPSGSYQMHVEDSVGCAWDSLVSVMVLDLDVDILVLNAECYGTPTGEIRIWMNDGIPPYMVMLDADTVASNINDNFTTLPSRYAGDYLLRVEDATTRRFDTLITIGEPDPIIISKSSTQPTCQEFELDGSISTDGSISYNSTGGSGGFTYTWTDSNTADSSRNELSIGTYIVAVSDRNNCTIIDTTIFNGQVIIDANIAILPNPNPDLSPPVFREDTTVCYLTQWDLVAFHGGSSVSYEWSPDTLLDDPSAAGSDEVTLTIRGNNTFSVVISTDQCFDSDEISINMFDTIGMHITTEAYRVEDTIYSPELKPLDLYSSDGFNSYIWYGDVGEFDNLLTQNTVLSPLGNQRVSVTGMTSEGCSEYDTIFVLIQQTIEEMYTVFTPNNDGFNDLWTIPNALQYPDIEVFIFNRWGQQIFYSKTYGVDRYNTWDGKSQKSGKELPVGTYYYVIKPNDGEQEPITGTVTIVR